MHQATLKSYTAGFLASIALTLAAYAVVAGGLLSGGTAVAAILALAVAQLVVQMILFLHVGSESGPRLNLASFIVAIILILIIVLGSVWIMGHLNYRMMASPSAVQDYVKSQQGF